MKPALYLALLPLIIFSPARAQDYEHGTALLCDTQKEVERYVELFHGKEQSAIPNQGSDDGACTGGSIHTKGGSVEWLHKTHHDATVWTIISASIRNYSQCS